MKVNCDIYLIPGIMAHVYLIVETSGLTLIDAGLPRNEQKIYKFIRKLGFSPQDIRNILITHSDYDHYGSLSQLKNVSRSRIFASSPDATSMGYGNSSRQLKPFGLLGFLYRITLPYFRAKPVMVDEIIQDGQIIPILEGMQVIDTRGHSSGHLSYYLANRKILFCGDSLRIVNGLFTSSMSAMTWDKSLSLEAIRKQASLKPDIVCPGHGQVVFNAARKFPNI